MSIAGVFKLSVLTNLVPFGPTFDAVLNFLGLLHGQNGVPEVFVWLKVNKGHPIAGGEVRAVEEVFLALGMSIKGHGRCVDTKWKDKVIVVLSLQRCGGKVG